MLADVERVERVDAADSDGSRRAEDRAASCLRRARARAAEAASRRARAASRRRPRERRDVRRNTNPPSARGSGCGRAAGLLTRGSLPRRLPGPCGQWHSGAGASPLTAAGPSRTCTGFPHPLALCEPEPTIGVVPLARVLALGSGRRSGRRVIFALSSMPDLGTGLGDWDLVLRKLRARRASTPCSALLLVRAVGGELPAAAARRRLRGRPTRCTRTSCPGATRRRSTSRSTRSASRSASSARRRAARHRTIAAMDDGKACRRPPARRAARAPRPAHGRARASSTAGSTRTRALAARSRSELRALNESLPGARLRRARPAGRTGRRRRTGRDGARGRALDGPPLSAEATGAPPTAETGERSEPAADAPSTGQR